MNTDHLKVPERSKSGWLHSWTVCPTGSSQSHASLTSQRHQRIKIYKQKSVQLRRLTCLNSAGQERGISRLKLRQCLRFDRINRFGGALPSLFQPSSSVNFTAP